MKKVLVLGAGMVARPLVRHLLNEQDFRVTVAEQEVDRAKALIAKHPRGTALELLAEEGATLKNLVAEHELTVSLLPASLHPVVAEMCIKCGKHMVTASYVSPQMKALDAPARKAGVVLLNEIGVDPGIDHMSAMRVIDGVRQRGGSITSFRSYCGGLPAPEANNNPWGYKFSWSPRAVCTAGKNAARFRENGKQVDIPGPDLFTCNHPVHVEGIGELEAYPNRDSLDYVDVYGLHDIETMYRGTLRYPGWCACLKKVVDLGLLSESPAVYPAGTTFAQWLAGFVHADSTDDLRRKVADHLGLDVASGVLDRFEWLGLFSDEALPITARETTALDVLAARMEAKMSYNPGERDMIALVHRFAARFPDGKQERISSTLIAFGEPGGDSAMARTVGLPAAVGAKLILTDRISDPGVHIPVSPNIYEPILEELATLGIRCEEQTVAAE